MKVKRKNKAKKEKEKTKVKRVKRIPKVVSPFKIVVRDWSSPFNEKQEVELNVDSTLEIHIDKNIYRVKINKKNRCLEFDTLEQHLFLQPVSYKCFLVKANSKKEEDGK